MYIGSADGSFYAIEPDGSLGWELSTGGIIDSAALVHDGRVTIGSGDGLLYCLRADAAPSPGEDRIIWRFQARSPESGGQFVSWWEGSIAAGPDGLMLVGNTGGHGYAVDAVGLETWSFHTGNAVWTAPAVGSDGTSYWGSLDFCVHAVDRAGRSKWAAPTLGFVVSSPALSLEGVLYVGSFDGVLYALDALTGASRWTFSTFDSIYSSPALLEGEDGSCTIVFASTDGSVYALGDDGTLKWRYDTGAVVRSSPVLSPMPTGEAGWIAYVGASDGVLYAIDVANGARRWSYDTTSAEPLAADRRSLNGSPALGTTGVYIGSEDGSVWYVPYDYPLHHPSTRGSVSPSEPVPDDIARLLFVSPGGSSSVLESQELACASVLVLRLVVRIEGATVRAELDDELQISCVPSVECSWRLSGDRQFIFIVPRSFWPAVEQLSVRVQGQWRSSGPKDGTRDAPEEIDQTTFVRPASAIGPLPLEVSETRTAALHMRRLSVPLPSFAASVNQIGFDSYDWLIGTLAVTHTSPTSGQLILFVHGAKRDGATSALVLDPSSPFAFAMHGDFEGCAVRVTAKGVELPFSFGPVPTDRFDLGFVLSGSSGAFGASMYAEIICAEVPFYGPLLLDYTRLADADGRMSASGTFLIDIPDHEVSAASRPAGVSVRAVTFRRPLPALPGSLSVLADGSLHGIELSVVLVDATTHVPVATLRAAGPSEAAGRSSTRASFIIDASQRLPAALDAVVVAGVFPLATAHLEG